MSQNHYTAKGAKGAKETKIKTYHGDATQQAAAKSSTLIELIAINRRGRSDSRASQRKTRSRSDSEE
jgi:hypothetical protein